MSLISHAACSLFLSLPIAIAFSAPAAWAKAGAAADDTHAWAVHDPDRPQPPVVTPGAPAFTPPPADAVVLFGETKPDLSAWLNRQGKPAPWTVGDGYFEVAPRTGPLATREAFGDMQLHLEWYVPSSMKDRVAQKRGNSGVFLMGLYEIQILDSKDNPTYPDGMAAAAYGQNPPLANAGLGLDRWQAYDIVFRRPRFDQDGKLLSPATVTVHHNGVLVQDRWAFEGPTLHRKRTSYNKPHGEAPLVLQDHKDPVRFRNVWVRRLPERPVSPVE